MTRKKWASVAMRGTVTLLLFVLLFKSFSWSTLLAALARADHRFILLSVPFGAFGLLVSAYQWQYLLRGEQIRVGLLKLVKLYLVGTGFSHFLPTGMGGDVVKAFYVGRESDNYAGSASAVVMTRLTGFFGMQLVAFTGLILWHASLQRNLILLAVLLSLLVGGMIGGVVLLAAVLPRVVKQSWTQNRMLARIIPVGNALLEAMKRPRLVASATGIGVVFWLLSTVNYYAYAQALRIPAPFSFYFVAIPVASLVAFLPITINGFGLRESAFVYIFATMHVPAASSLLLALFMDMQVLFFGAIGGVFYLTMRRDDRAIHLPVPGRLQEGSSTTEGVGTRFIASSNIVTSSNIMWFTQEELDALNAEEFAFDDSAPTLPLLLVEAWTAKKRQATPTRGGDQKEGMGKNKRITLMRKETDLHVPAIDEGMASAARETTPFQTDTFVSRGL